MNILFLPENASAYKLYFIYEMVEAVATDEWGRGKINFKTVDQLSFAFCKLAFSE